MIVPRWFLRDDFLNSSIPISLLKVAISMSDDDEGSGIMGWVIFLLIFGAGNAILYATTGIILIPRR